MIPILIFGTVSTLVLIKQDELIKQELESLNNSFAGKISITNFHLAPFKNFPYVSIEVDGIQLFESKNVDESEFLNIDKTYIGFDILDILQGKFKVEKILFQNGNIRILKNENSQYNFETAFKTSEKETESESESAPITIDLE